MEYGAFTSEIHGEWNYVPSTTVKLALSFSLSELGTEQVAIAVR
jgi:hypothetical protein